MSEKTELVQTLKQKFYSDSPDGLRIATMSRWPGRMILGPRAQLKDALGLMRPLLESTTATTIPGVYFLTTKKGPQTLYIGQSRALRARLRTHHANRPDWEQFAIASCTDTNLPLTTADTAYLEWKLIQHAEKAKQVKLKNRQNPLPPSVEEEKKLDLDSWFNGILQISSLLGMKYFVDKTQQDTSSVDDSPTIFELNLPRGGGQALGMNGDESFVVLAGSAATGKWTSKSEGNDKAKALLAELLSNGSLVRNGNCYRFKQDHEFNSTSLAAKVIVGGPRSGPESWMVEGTTTTYKEWHSAGADADRNPDK